MNNHESSFRFRQAGNIVALLLVMTLGLCFGSILMEAACLDATTQGSLGLLRERVSPDAFEKMRCFSGADWSLAALLKLASGHLTHLRTGMAAGLIAGLGLLISQAIKPVLTRLSEAAARSCHRLVGWQTRRWRDERDPAEFANALRVANMVILSCAALLVVVFVPESGLFLFMLAAFIFWGLPLLQNIANLPLRSTAVRLFTLWAIAGSITSWAPKASLLVVALAIGLSGRSDDDKPLTRQQTPTD